MCNFLQQQRMLHHGKQKSVLQWNRKNSNKFLCLKAAMNGCAKIFEPEEVDGVEYTSMILRQYVMRIIFSSQTYCNIHHRLLLASVLSYAVILHIIIFLFLYPHSISLILPQQNKPDDEPPLVSNLDLECKSFIICIISMFNLPILYVWLILLNASVCVGH